MHRRAFLATSLAACSLAADPVPKLRVGVIGHTGRGNYGHGIDTMWLQLPGAEIVAIADADEKGLTTAKTRLKCEKGFADYRKMLAESKPDVVAAGPRHVDQHRDMLLAAIEAGAKGIYIEKPFCRTPAEADEIIAAAGKLNCKIAIAHRNRYHPVLPVLTRLIEDGTIGKILEIRARGKEDARGGGLDLWVLGSHLLNLATFFGGKPLACSASVFQAGRQATKSDVKQGDEGIGLLAGDEIHARFDMERGFPLYFDSIRNAGVASAGFGIQIIGTKGILDLRADTEPAAHLLPGSPFQPVKDAKAWTPVTTAGVGKPEPIADLGKQMAAHRLPGLDLIAAIRENKTPLCDAKAGAETVEMIAAVFESHRLGGQRVALPLKERGNPIAKW